MPSIAFEGLLSWIARFQDLFFSTFGFEALSFAVAIVVACVCLAQVVRHEDALVRKKWQLVHEESEVKHSPRRDISTFAVDIRNAVRLGNMPAAAEMMQTMIESCGKPGRSKKGCWISCFSDLVHGYVRLGQLQKGEEWLVAFMDSAPLIRPNIACVNALVHALTKAGETARAEALVERLPAINVVMNECTYYSMIDMYMMKGEKEIAIAWIRKMTAAGMKLKPEHYQVFRQAFHQEVMQVNGTLCTRGLGVAEEPLIKPESAKAVANLGGDLKSISVSNHVAVPNGAERHKPVLMRNYLVPLRPEFPSPLSLSMGSYMTSEVQQGSIFVPGGSAHPHATHHAWPQDFDTSIGSTARPASDCWRPPVGTRFAHWHESESWHTNGQHTWNDSDRGWVTTEWQINQDKSRSSTSNQKHARRKEPEHKHDENYYTKRATTDALVGLWQDPEGATYEVWAKDYGVWSCMRKGAVLPSREFNILYDRENDVYWWGVKRKFYLCASEVARQSDSLTWYQGGAHWEQWKPMYTWYRLRHRAQGNHQSWDWKKKRADAEENEENNEAQTKLKWRPVRKKSSEESKETENNIGAKDAHAPEM